MPNFIRGAYAPINHEQLLMALLKDLQLAWRNLWRNRKRTVITISAVVLAVLLSSIASSMQEGTYARMIDNIVKFYTGYIQVQHPGYRESRSINDTFEPDSALNKVLESSGEILLAVPRLESFTLISSGENTKGCSLVGIDPEKEDRLTGLSKWVQQGKYLSGGENGILLAVNIAANLGVIVGDTLVLISQGYHGASASALVPLRGILKFPSPELNNVACYMDLERAQEFYSATGRITSLSMMITNYRRVNRTARLLARQLHPAYSVMTWDEMQPELVKMIESDRAGAVVMKGVLYLVVGFGILGTIIMMMAERRKEMGVMIAIGMQKYRLQRMLVFESLLLSMLGVITGVLLSIPVILFFMRHPIMMPGEAGRVYESFGIEAAMYFSMAPAVLLNQALTVFIITLLITVYPLMSVYGMKIITALRGG